VIASISGKVINLEAHSVVVEVGGIGYSVNIPKPLLEQLRRGENISLHTYLVVRQDALSLYGFSNLEERDFFSMLLGVDGIGPRLALAILSSLSTEAIRRSVFNEQPEVFSRVPGVGKKTAQKILLYLQDRIPSVEGLAPIAVMTDVDTEVLDALTTLGYSVVEAQAALQSIPRDAPQEVEERLRLALRYFSP
jgi:Holliday junction DNA helicase RuvA